MLINSNKQFKKKQINKKRKLNLNNLQMIMKFNIKKKYLRQNKNFMLKLLHNSKSKDRKT